MRISETFLSENSGATLAARFPPAEIVSAETPWAAPEKPQVSLVALHTLHCHIYTRFPAPVPQWVLKAI